MGLSLKQGAFVVSIVVAVFVGGVLYPLWRSAVDRNEDVRADPHHIAGNLYFVGDPADAAFLLVGDMGHVLIAGGGPGDAHKIVDNVEQLGFEIADVRALLAAGPTGSLAALQQASRGDVWASEADAGVLASGGTNDPSRIYTPFKVMAWAGIETYPPPRIDHRVKDGETIRIGTLAVTAHVVGDGFPCTAWTFTVHDGERDLRVVHRCGLELPYTASLVEPEQPPGIRAGFERTLGMLRNLPVDIWLTAHGVEYGRFRKYQASLSAADPAAPFIDPDGYRESIDKAEARFRALLAEQEKQRRSPP